jgi:hypothetical protein
MMAAAAEHVGGGRLWRQWGTTAMADNDSGGRQRRRMMMACKVERRTTRRKEEGGRQTTMALGQPGRERETNIKKSSLCKILFSAIRSLQLEFSLPPKTNSFPFRFISLIYTTPQQDGCETAVRQLVVGFSRRSSIKNKKCPIIF